MDYYYYDHLGDSEVEDSEDYDYDSVLLPDEESFMDVCERCVKSSSLQVQQYIIILLGCGFLQRLAWEIVIRTLGNKYECLYHIISLFCGFLCLLFYVGISSSFYVCLHVLNLCFFLKVMTKLKLNYIGVLLCLYTIICQLFFEYVLKLEQYETIRGPQMVVGMKFISVAFDVIDDKEKYQFITFLGYLLSPASIILGPWVPLKEYMPNYNSRNKLMQHIGKVLLNILFAITFLNLSNCILPWLKQLLGAGLWCITYLDALSVRCSHYFVCYLSQATLMSSTTKSLNFPSLYLTRTQSIVNVWAIEFPRSLSDVIRSWNIPMHLWLKQNIFNRLRFKQYPYIVAIFLTYLVSCLVHGFNFKVHLVLISLSFFSYSENLLRHYLAQVFDACIESKGCKQNCSYSNCSRKQRKSFTTALLLVHLVNFLFSLIVIFQLAYLGVMLNTSTNSMNSKNILQTWSNMNYMGHMLAIAMFAFYKII